MTFTQQTIRLDRWPLQIFHHIEFDTAEKQYINIANDSPSQLTHVEAAIFNMEIANKYPLQLIWWYTIPTSAFLQFLDL